MFSSFSVALILDVKFVSNKVECWESTQKGIFVYCSGPANFFLPIPPPLTFHTYEQTRKIKTNRK